MLPDFRDHRLDLPRDLHGGLVGQIRQEKLAPCTKLWLHLHRSHWTAPKAPRHWEIWLLIITCAAVLCTLEVRKRASLAAICFCSRLIHTSPATGVLPLLPGNNAQGAEQQEHSC